MFYYVFIKNVKQILISQMTEKGGFATCMINFLLLFNMKPRTGEAIDNENTKTANKATGQRTSSLHASVLAASDWRKRT